MFNNLFFFENRAVYEIMWKNIAEEGRSQRQYGTCALHAGYLRLQIHTVRSCNTHCFSIATTVDRTRLNVTLYVHCLSCLLLRISWICFLYPISGKCCQSEPSIWGAFNLFIGCLQFSVFTSSLLSSLHQRLLVFGLFRDYFYFSASGPKFQEFLFCCVYMSE